MNKMNETIILLANNEGEEIQTDQINALLKPEI